MNNYTIHGSQPLVGVIMGSQTDWATLSESSRILEEFSVPHECAIISAHRTPDNLAQYAKSARQRGLQVIIAGAGGAAHLPGMCAAWTTLPVLGVPVESSVLCGVDSLLSIVQMPKGIPVGTLAIGISGAVNAALLAIQILSLKNQTLARKLEEYRNKNSEKVIAASSLLATQLSCIPDKKTSL